VDFEEQVMALSLAMFVAMFSSMTLKASHDLAPSGAALISGAKAGIRALVAPEVWPRIVEGMGSEAGPWSLDPAPEPGRANSR
jgi:hypothetical protein